MRLKRYLHYLTYFSLVYKKYNDNYCNNNHSFFVFCPEMFDYIYKFIHCIHPYNNPPNKPPRPPNIAPVPAPNPVICPNEAPIIAPPAAVPKGLALGF